MIILLSVPGIIEILIILALIIFLFGAKRIPGIAKGIGKGIRDFNDAKKGKEEDDTSKEP